MTLLIYHHEKVKMFTYTMKYQQDGLVQNSEDIHGPQRMNPTYLGDPFFPPAGLFFKFFRMD